MAKQYPQKIEPSVTFEIAKALAERPELFALGMAVIAAHSEAESNISQIMITLLGTNPRPGAAIFNVIRANHLQAKAVCEVASAVLDDNDVKKLRETLKIFDRSADYRNRIAHRMWGIDKNISDGVVFAKIDTPTNFQVDVLRIPAMKTPQDRKHFMSEVQYRMKSSLEVWRKEDFEEAIVVSTQAKDELMKFHLEILPKAMLGSIDASSVFSLAE